MYAFNSPPRGRMFHLIVCLCFVAAFLLLGVGGIEGIEYPLLYQLTAVILLTAGTYLTVRYALRSYRYEIADSGIVSATGDPVYDLVITETAGRRQRVVTRITLRSIADMAVFSGKKSEKEKECRWIGSCRVFRYTNRPFEPEGCYLLVPEENSVVVIPKDERMIQYLNMFVSPERKEKDI